MAVFGNIVINDGLVTPVAHTFAPALRNGNTLEWHDRSAGVLAGYNRIVLTTRLMSGRSGVYRVTLKVLAPTLAVTAPGSGSGVQPNPVEAYHTESIHQWLIPAASNDDARSTAMAYSANLLQNSQITDTVKLMAPPL